MCYTLETFFHNACFSILPFIIASLAVGFPGGSKFALRCINNGSYYVTDRG